MKSTTTRSQVCNCQFLSLSLSPTLFAQTHKAPPTDWLIEAEVQKALTSDHIFVGPSIMSSVNQGVVKLIGNVRSETESNMRLLTSHTSNRAIGNPDASRPVVRIRRA